METALLLLLAGLWGSSYLFIKIAVLDIAPLSLIALRVSGAAGFLLLVMAFRSERLPRGLQTWRRLFVQAVLNSIGAWTLLAWGQQSVDAGLASVLNSTSPVFVLLIMTAMSRHEGLSARKLFGALLGLLGVVLVVGTDVLQGLGDQVAAQFACLAGAALYSGAAIHGRSFPHLTPLAIATGTMIWASVVLIPLAIVMERPWTFTPGLDAWIATAALSIACTGIALLLYFRLVRTLGSVGVASQSYLRAGIGVLLGMVFLGETFSVSVGLGLATAMVGVALINWPERKPIREPQ